MTFTATSAVKDRTAVITLTGDLDSTTAPQFREEVANAVGDGDLDRLVLDVSGLGYMSSAGIRGLVYARQKMRGDVRILLVGAVPAVEQTIRLVGLHRSVTMVDVMPEFG